MIEFTEEELKKYNGNNEQAAYVAFKGKVYDVSSSKFWKNGTHFKKHFAGHDLTAELADAPHGDEVFQNCPQIGALFTLIIGLIPLSQKLLNPDVPFSTGADGITYHAIIFITVISITIVGYYGGKITWRAKE